MTLIAAIAEQFGPWVAVLWLGSFYVLGSLAFLAAVRALAKDRRVMVLALLLVVVTGATGIHASVPIANLCDGTEPFMSAIWWLHGCYWA